MQKIDSTGPRLVGYKVVTQSLLVGTRVYRKGDVIGLEEAGSDLDYCRGLKLIEPIYETAPVADSSAESERKPSLLKSGPVFWKL